MKRSEMLDIIESCLYGLLKDDSQLNCRAVSKVILSHVEGAGMLPPIIEDKVLTPIYEGDVDTWIGNMDEFTPVFALTWEPEDE